LCGSIPITTAPTVDLHPLARTVGCSSWEGTYFESNSPLLSHSPLTAESGPRRPNESHATKRGQPMREQRTGPLDQASPDPILGSMQQVADERPLLLMGGGAEQAPIARTAEDEGTGRP
jgi:hypothetical protein